MPREHPDELGPMLASCRVGFCLRNAIDGQHHERMDGRRKADRLRSGADPPEDYPDVLLDRSVYQGGDFSNKMP